MGNEGFSLGLWLQDRVVVALGLLQENLGCHQQEQLWFRLIGDGFDCSGACSWLESRGLCGGSAAIPSSSEVSSFPHVCSRANRIRDLMGGSPLRFRPLPISGHCMVVPFLVTKLCSPGKSVLRYLCQVTACTGPPVVLTGPPARAQLRQQLWMATGAPGKCVPSVQSSQKSRCIYFLFPWLSL